MAERALATAFVNIVPGTKDLDLYLKNKLGDDMERGGRNAGERLGGGMVAAAKSFVGPLIAAFGAFTAIDFFRGSIDAASTLSESQNAIKVTFGEASNAIAKLGEDSAKRLGLATSDFNGIAVQFSSFATKIAGAGGDVSGVINELTTRGADFASVMNLDVSEALGAFQSGLAGETEPLKRFGIDLSDAAIKAYAMANGIGTAGKEMTEGEKVQARYGALMEQTAKTAGDFANTSDGLANSQRIANAEIENARARMGEALLPIMATVTTFMANTFIPVIDFMGEAFKNVFSFIDANKNWLVPVVAAIGGMVVAYTAISTALRISASLQAAYAAASYGAAAATYAWGTAAKIGAAAFYLMNTPLTTVIAQTWAWTAALLANPITWVVLAIGALIAAIVLLIANWDTVVAFLHDVFGPAFEWLGSLFTSVYETVIKPVFDGIAAMFTWLYENIILPIIQGIVLYVIIWANIFTWLYENMLKPVFNFIGMLFTWIYQNIIQPVIDRIVASVQAWGRIFTWLYENIVKPVFQGLGAAFNFIWTNVIKPVIDWISGAIQNVGTVIGTVFGAIATVVGDAFNAVIGVVRGPINIIIGLINGIIDRINTIKIDIPEFAQGLFGGAKKLGFNIPRIPALAKGGFVDSPTTALIGEAGPEVVTPLKDFERMMGMDGNGKTVNYYAAPNQSIDSEQALMTALKRAKVLASW
jgi:hypothetical protein